MDAVEQSLLLALEANPSDWDVRFLIAEKKIARDAPGEAATLIALAPEPPETDAELERAVVIVPGAVVVVGGWASGGEEDERRGEPQEANGGLHHRAKR